MKKYLFLCFCCSLSIALTAQQKLWVGSYTQASPFGIRLLLFNATDGSLTVLDSVAIPQASFLTYSQKGILYAVEEDTEGKVHAIRKNADNRFEKYSTQPTHGKHPCYIALDKTEQWLTVGNYSSGNLTLYKINEDGSISEPVSTLQHTGKSTNKERQEAAHVHSTVFTPDNRFLLVPDLGIDTVKVYTFNEKTGELTPRYAQSIPFARGGGPRHIAFHPNGKWFYILGELNGMVDVYHYNNQHFQYIESVSALPDGFQGRFTAADIHVSHDGKHLYATLRDQLNSITLFEIQNNGSIKQKNIHATGGKTPRNFFISKDDNWLMVENQNSNKIVVFKRDKNSGEIEYYNHLENIIQPVCMINKD